MKDCTMNYLLGIDVGTAGTKSALFSEQGDLMDLAYREYGLFYPNEGWVEQNPDDWWRALVETVREITERNKCGKDVVALSLSTQGGALVLLDKDFHAVYPAVSWLDARAEETADKLLRKISREELYEMSGWPITGGLNLPVVFWFKEKHPELYQKSRFFASTIDYINYLLTGRFAIDYTNLALTMFLDLDKRDWSQKGLAITGLTRANVPEIVVSGQVLGKLSSDAARTLGLSDEVTVVSGAHDQYCASIGAGAVNTGDCVLSCGTAWVLLATCDRLYFDEQSLGGRGITQSVFPGIHPVPGKFGLMTSVPFGGNSLKWFRDVMRPGHSFEMLDEAAAGVQPGSEGLAFVPISSSRSGKGAFLGIDGMHGEPHFVRAIMEGVSFVNRRHLAMIRHAGVQVKKLIMIGGGSKSSVWPRIVADTCNTRVVLPRITEAACAGAAVLAGVGSGLFGSIEEASVQIAGVKSIIKPVNDTVRLYTDRYKRFVEYLGCA